MRVRGRPQTDAPHALDTAVRPPFGCERPAVRFGPVPGSDRSAKPGPLGVVPSLKGRARPPAHGDGSVRRGAEGAHTGSSGVQWPVSAPAAGTVTPAGTPPPSAAAAQPPPERAFLPTDEGLRRARGGPDRRPAATGERGDCCSHVVAPRARSCWEDAAAAGPAPFCLGDNEQSRDGKRSASWPHGGRLHDLLVLSTWLRSVYINHENHC